MSAVSEELQHRAHADDPDGATFIVARTYRLDNIRAECSRYAGRAARVRYRHRTPILRRRFAVQPTASPHATSSKTAVAGSGAGIVFTVRFADPLANGGPVTDSPKLLRHTT